MKVLGINGSHRKGGNTRFFLKRALDACRRDGLETQLVELWNKEIGFCTHCNHCKEHPGECSIRDDVPGILQKMKEADGIILASPTYFASISGRMKALMDRSVTLRRDSYALKNKPGGGITLGASRNGGQEHALTQIINFFLFQGMLPVADQETAHFGGIAWVAGGSRPEDDSTGAETCENLGKRLASVLRLVKK
jgi:multimeric flavodoxin WrbA